VRVCLQKWTVRLAEPEFAKGTHAVRLSFLSLTLYEADRADSLEVV
jgi:hypothetical protein